MQLRVLLSRVARAGGVEEMEPGEIEGEVEAKAEEEEEVAIMEKAMRAGGSKEGTPDVEVEVEVEEGEDEVEQ